VDTESHAASDVTSSPRRVGAMLAEARAAAGIELSEIARDTRVPLRHLRAIETDAHESLPALPYTIGFVKSFARAVGRDPEAVAAQFRAETSKTAHVPAQPTMEPLDERRLPPRGLLTLSIVGVIAVVGAVVAYSAGAFDGPPPHEPTTQASPAASVAAAPAAATDAAPAVPASQGAPAIVTPTATAAAPPAHVSSAPGNVVITAIEDAWFRVSGVDPASGKVVTIKTGVLAKGERYVVPQTAGLKLWTGRAGALRLSVDGRTLPPLGGEVETVKNVSLDAGDLRARLNAPPAATVPTGPAGSTQ